MSSLQAQFQAERKQRAKYISFEDQKIAQNMATTLSGIINQEPKTADLLNYSQPPVQKQLLFDSIKWDGANFAYPVPESKGVPREENAGFVKRTVQSTCAVNEGIGNYRADL
ncbi:MAG: hypothetical protein EZS28_036531 [Streblomastix strix]|uniref:Uncharacterized protein n=1 Tax=Streblomastix strix TaxID=222440 RepID=A0A5J4UDI4_9EUKA|nr:MAG: hypothetical protein EZS28_036531 [Streblomastix strix]